MAVDEDGPNPNPPGQATPNRGLRREPPVIDATATPPEPRDVPPGTDPAGDEPAGMDVMADNPELREAFAPSGEPAAEAEPVTEANDEPSSPRRVLAPLLLFGLGLVIAALLAAVLSRQFNPPVDEAAMAQATRVDALQQRLAALEAKPAPVTNTAPLADRIGKLEGSASAFKAQLDDLQAKLVAQATATAAAASPAPTPPEPAVDLGPLQARIADLEAGAKALRDQVAALPKTDDTAAKQVAGLSQGLAAVQAAVAGVPRVDLAPLDHKVADLGTAVSGLQAAVAGMPRVDLDPLKAKLDALQHRVDPIEVALAVPKDGSRVTEERRNGSAAEAHAAPMAIAAQAVVQAVADGRPFGDALAALQGLGADPAALDRLRPVADKGAPTRATILAGFEADRPAMLGAGQSAPAGSVLDRVMAGARGLVKVRDTGTSPGQDPDAVVSRIAAALQNGDLKGALAEWGGLPADGKASSQPWADELKVRVDAEEAARGIAAGAVAALAPPK